MTDDNLIEFPSASKTDDKSVERLHCGSCDGFEFIVIRGGRLECANPECCEWVNNVYVIEALPPKDVS